MLRITRKQCNDLHIPLHECSYRQVGFGEMEKNTSLSMSPGGYSRNGKYFHGGGLQLMTK